MLRPEGGGISLGKKSISGRENSMGKSKRQESLIYLIGPERIVWLKYDK